MSDFFDPEGDVDYGDEPPSIDASAEVDALEKAGWHLRTIRRLRNRAADIDELYDREVAKLDTWRGVEQGKLNGRIAWHEAPLAQLSEALRRADPRRKTIILPDGALKTRVPEKPQVFVEDQDALLAWAAENAPELLPAPTKVNVSDLRRMTVGKADGTVVFKDTGQIVPHAVAEVPEPQWWCDPSPPADTPEGAF